MVGGIPMIWRILGSVEAWGFLTIALVIPSLTWGMGISAWWQSWLLGFGLLAAQLGILALGTRVTLLSWLMVAVLLVVGTRPCVRAIVAPSKESRFMGVWFEDLTARR